MIGFGTSGSMGVWLTGVAYPATRRGSSSQRRSRRLIERRRNMRRDLIRGILDRVSRKMRVPCRGLNLRIPEQLPDHR